MNDPNKNPTLLGEALLDTIRQAVRDEIRSILNQHGHDEGDHLLHAEEAAKILCVSPDWLYRHASHLPFTRKLGPKMLRFSFRGV